jgi:hypothetical protein
MLVEVQIDGLCGNDAASFLSDFQKRRSRWNGATSLSRTIKSVPKGAMVLLLLWTRVQLPSACVHQKTDSEIG